VVNLYIFGYLIIVGCVEWRERCTTVETVLKVISSKPKVLSFVDSVEKRLKAS